MCEVIHLPDGSTAIVCRSDHMTAGHICNQDASVYETSDGKRFFFKTIDEGHEWYLKNYKSESPLNIVMGSVACSVCEGAAVDKAAWL